jgi:hypothetical protein
MTQNNESMDAYRATLINPAIVSQDERNAGACVPQPYGAEYVTEVGHRLDSAHGKCVRCEADAIDLYEDAAYGDVRRCVNDTE